MTVRIYGRVTNWGSHAQVTEGFRIGLTHHEQLAGLMPVDLSTDEEQISGTSADVGLMTGPLTALGQISPTHRLRAAVVAPNSSRIPPALAKVIDENVHLVLAPSEWAHGVLSRELRTPVITVPHGVHPHMRVVPNLRRIVGELFSDGVFHLMHFSTTDRERKGTLELLKAWALVREHLGKKRCLFLILDPNAQSRLADDLVEHGLSMEEVVTLPRVEQMGSGRVGAPPTVVANTMSHAHCIIQPSRGEGFGLIPLEARACGVPVIATTAATGHAEHLRGTSMRDGVVSIPVGPEAPIDDVPGATAPTVRVADIVEAIHNAYHSYELLHENALEMAESVQQKWAWPTVIEPFLKEIARD